MALEMMGKHRSPCVDPPEPRTVRSRTSLGKAERGAHLESAIGEMTAFLPDLVVNFYIKTVS